MNLCVIHCTIHYTVQDILYSVILCNTVYTVQRYTIQYSTYNITLYSTVHTVQCHTNTSIVHTVQCHTRQYSIILYSTLYSTYSTLYSTYSTKLYYTIEYNQYIKSVQYSIVHTVQCHTIQYSVILYSTLYSTYSTLYSTYSTTLYYTIEHNQYIKSVPDRFNQVVSLGCELSSFVWLFQSVAGKYRDCTPVQYSTGQYSTVQYRTVQYSKYLKNALKILVNHKNTWFILVEESLKKHSKLGIVSQVRDTTPSYFWPPKNLKSYSEHFW